MDISIVRLDRQGRDILVIRQAGASDQTARGHFILCRPIGQEATRTAAMFRVLSDRLVRQGCTVWRFDYHGTGDAGGDEGAQSLSDWTQDLATVHQHVSRSEDGPIRWFAMGLGGVVALNAAAKLPDAPAHLVLWEPVTQGETYLDALKEGHRRELAREFGYSWPQLLAQGRVQEPALPGDVLGFDYGPALVDDIQRIDQLPLAAALRRGTRILCALHEPDRQHIEPQLISANLQWHTVETRTDWMSSQAMGTAIVPTDALKAVLSAIQ